MVGLNNHQVADILPTKSLKEILHHYGDPELVSSELRPAAAGMAGYLGDHFRLTLRVRRLCGPVEDIQLFVKTMPLQNQARAQFIHDCNYFKREVLMFQLLDAMNPDQGPNPWSMKALLKTDEVIVMPDLAAEGYSTCPQTSPLDLPRALLAAAALARYHAAYADYETRQTLTRNKPYNVLEEYADIITEPTFRDSPWVRAAAKLTANFLQTFSTKYNTNTEQLELALAKLNVDACDSLVEYKDTLNVLIHKDLWINNVMFKYEGGVATNARILDFQLVRYAPPAFDLMVFLYYCTARSLRDAHEQEIYNHYYTVFEASLSAASRARLRRLRYGRAAFLRGCARARLFALFEAVGCAPQVCMEPAAARRVFDDPATYHRLVNEDRTAPVVAHAHRDARYRRWLLELFEEYVERYLHDY